MPGTCCKRVCLAGLLFTLALIGLLYLNVNHHQSYRYRKDGKLVFDRKFVLESELTPVGKAIEYFLVAFNVDLSLNSTVLMEEAKKNCGPEFYKVVGVNDSFVKQNLDLLIKSVNSESKTITLLGRAFYKLEIMTNLCHLAKVQTFVSKHPQVFHEKVKAIVLTGPARSGTTALFSLLASHPDLQYVTVAEALQPLARESLGGNYYLGWLDERYWAALVGGQISFVFLPLLKQMIGNFILPLAPFEDFILAHPTFLSSFYGSIFTVPTYDAHFRNAHNHIHLEKYTKLMLQIIQYQTGRRKTWILKSPQTIETLLARRDVFGLDTKFIFTHRYSRDLLKSSLALFLYSARIRENRGEIELKQAIEYHVERFQYVLNEKMSRKRIHSVVGLENQMHVKFGEVEENIIRVGFKVLDYLNIRKDAQVLQAFQSYVSQNPRGGANAIYYDLNSFVSEENLRGKFDAYDKENGFI